MELIEETEPSQNVPAGPGPEPMLALGDEVDVVSPAYVYALGRIEARFPSPGIERELAQVVGRADTAGQTDRETFHSVLKPRENRYLARRLCWVFTIEGLETYILQPVDPADFGLLVEAIRPAPRRTDIDLVIGTRGPLAPAHLCGGLTLPTVAFEQLYSFDTDTLLKSIPRPQSIPAKQFEATAEELFTRIMQMVDNAGATDEHRALNYLAARYPAIYELATDRHGEDNSLSAVDVLPSRLSGTRKIVDVVFSYTHRTTGVTDKWFVRVDVSEDFPSVHSPLSPYYDR